MSSQDRQKVVKAMVEARIRMLKLGMRRPRVRK